MEDGTTTPSTAVVATSFDPGSGGPVNTDWVQFNYTGSSIITKISTDQICNESGGGGCGCTFEKKGGWSGVTISLLVDVNINMVSYCTTPNQLNMHNDICYNFMSDYIVNNGATQAITDYLSFYCATKYPNATLDLFNTQFDQKDYNICACNLAQSNYDQFEQSIKSQFPSLDLGSIRPQCIFPPCVNSTFKGIELDNCPLPLCLQIVDIGQNNSAGNVTVNQNANCSQFGITNGSTPSQSSSKYSKVIIIIIAIIVLILFISLIWIALT
jgi:hypothetical protein